MEKLQCKDCNYLLSQITDNITIVSKYWTVSVPYRLLGIQHKLVPLFALSCSIRWLGCENRNFHSAINLVIVTYSCNFILRYINLQMTNASLVDVDESCLNGYIAGCSSVLGRLPVDTTEYPLTLYQRVVASVRNNYQVRSQLMFHWKQWCIFTARC